MQSPHAVNALVVTMFGNTMQRSAGQ